MRKFEDILVQCIEDIKAGRSSIEDCKDRYPSMREQNVKARIWLMDPIHCWKAETKCS